MWFIGSLIALSVVAKQPQDVEKGSQCRNYMARASQFLHDGELNDKTIKALVDGRAESQRVLPAALNTIRRYREEGKFLSMGMPEQIEEHYPDLDKFEAHWVEQLRQRTDLPSWNSISMKDVSNKQLTDESGSNYKVVLDVELEDGRRVIARGVPDRVIEFPDDPAEFLAMSPEMQSAARNTSSLAAWSRHNLAGFLFSQKAMGVSGHAPVTRPAYIDGQLYIVSDFIAHLDEDLEPEIDFSELEPKKLSNALVLQFLVADWDLVFTNVKRQHKPGEEELFSPGWKNTLRLQDSDGDKRLMFFDYDVAFFGGVIPHQEDSNTRFLGSSLPEKYTPEMIEALKNLTKEALTRQLGGVLSPFEIDNIIFRRDIILEDIRLRSGSAHFEQ